MSDGTEHKESLDHFSSYLKGRLENHPTPVDPGGWDKIAGQLQRRKRSRLGWIASGIAAAILLAVLWLSIPLEMETVQEQLAKEELPPLPTQIERSELDEVEPIAEIPVIQPPVMTNRKAGRRETRAKIVSTTTVVEEEKQPNGIEEKTVEQPPAPEQHAQPARAIRTREAEPTHYAELPRKKKENGQWLLAVAMGTGGGDISLQLGSMNDYANPGALQNMPGFQYPFFPDISANEHPEPEQYVDMEHAIPMSVGLTIRKELSPRFAVESGLIYTYLSSELKKNRVSKSDRLQQHYLGIPVNLVVNLMNRPRWNVYASGGVVLEKGLQSVLTRRQYVSHELISQTERHSISGIQVSLNGAIGIGYRLVDHWSLYAEPKIYYYFDTDQPPSSRTEHPFGLGISAGVRYHF